MKTTCCCVALFGVVLTACSPTPEAAFEKRSTPEIKIFPIGGYSGTPVRDKEAGFTLVGPVYGAKRKTILQESENAGLPCIYTIGIEFDFLDKKEGPPAALDPDAIREEIRRQVEAVADRQSIVAWYLIPEELRNWKKLELDYLQIASEAIREADPGGRPVWMYEPGHRTQASLEKTFPHQQIVGKGVYPNYSGRKTERAWVSWTLEQQARAMQSSSPEAIPYGILEMFKKPDEQLTPEEIRSWVRHDAYASLIAGVKGIVIYSFGNRTGFHHSTPEWKTYYEAWSSVARELNGPLQLGSVVLDGKPADPPSFEIVSGPAKTQLSGSNSNPADPVEVPSLATTAFTWSGKTWWFLVNSSNEAIRLTVNTEAGNWTPLLDQQPTFQTNTRELELPPLAAAVFRTTSP